MDIVFVILLLAAFTGFLTWKIVTARKTDGTSTPAKPITPKRSPGQHEN